MKGRPNANHGRRFPVETLTESEVHALLAACSAKSATGLRNRALIVALYRAGLRCSEALDLYPKDVDLETGLITVLCGKGGKRRVVGIDPGATAVIGRWADRRRRMGYTGHQPLFCTFSAGSVRGKGRKLHSSYVRELFHRLGEKAGIEKRVHAHQLRHTHAYELLMEGKPLGVIRKQLGHADLATTMRYLDHLAPAEALKAVQERSWSDELAA